jgi:hypothetical protein
LAIYQQFEKIPTAFIPMWTVLAWTGSLTDLRETPADAIDRATFRSPIRPVLSSVSIIARAGRPVGRRLRQEHGCREATARDPGAMLRGYNPKLSDVANAVIAGRTGTHDLLGSPALACTAMGSWL